MSEPSDLHRRSEGFRDKQRDKLWKLVMEASEILRQIDPRKRVNFKQNVRRRLYKEQSGSCAICGGLLEEDLAEVDHIIPFSKGGGNETENIWLTHKDCNRQKSDQVDPVDLLRYLESEVRNLPASKQIFYLGRAL